MAEPHALQSDSSSMNLIYFIIDELPKTSYEMSFGLISVAWSVGNVVKDIIVNIRNNPPLPIAPLALLAKDQVAAKSGRKGRAE